MGWFFVSGMMGRFNLTMKKNPFQHIDIRVNNLEEAWPNKRGFSAHGTLPDQAWIVFMEDKGHQANTNRISFWAESRKRVDEIGELLEDAGARNVSGPRECPEYSPTYYAVFFEDPFGNCLEVCYRV